MHSHIHTNTHAKVDERTRHEIYYPPFKGAVEAGVGSFMCSYNKINTGNGDIYACENPQTLLADLKGGLKFNGWVMSDWYVCIYIPITYT